jgi:general stress protein CsbA
MSFGQKISVLSQDLQTGTKVVTHGLFHISLRLISAFFIGMVLALIIQELTQSGQYMLIFMTCVLTASLFKGLTRLTLLQILVFDLFCILLGTILRMYILLAPG